MEEMPTGVVTRVMEECQMAYEAMKLYKLTWTTVDSHAHVVEVEDEPNHAEVKLSHKTQTLIVEAVDERPDNPNGHGGKISCMDLPDYGMVLTSWVNHFTKQPSTPLVMMPSDHMVYGSSDRMVIVHSIEPFRKRARVTG